MTVRELIEELKRYHDQDADVVIFGGLDIKKVGICDTGKYAEIFTKSDSYSNYDISDILEDIDEAISGLQDIDLEDCEDSIESELAIDSAVDVLGTVASLLEDMT